MLDLPATSLGADTHWRALAERIGTALHAPGNAWVLLPAGTDTEPLLRCLQRSLRDPPPECLPLANAPADSFYQTIAAYGAEEPGLGRMGRDDCVRLCAENGREAVLVLDLTAATSDEQDEAAAFASSWAQRVRLLGPDQPWPRLVCLLSGSRRWTDLADVRLAVVPSWDVAASCDGCEGWQRHLEGGSPEERLWLRAVLPELACFDYRLTELEVWQRARCLGALREVLHAVAERRGWTADDPGLQSLLSRVPHSGTLPTGAAGYLPTALLPLWHRGMLGLVAGVGWDLHGALLSAPGRGPALAYRVWRGLTRVLGPLLEAHRLCAEYLLRERQGNEPFEQQIDDLRLAAQADPVPVAVQAPSLHELATLARQLSLPWWHAASRAHSEVRNPLAHGRPVEPSALSCLLQLSEECAPDAC